jgi:hypothetical protein
MAILIGDIAINLDFEQRVNDASAVMFTTEIHQGSPVLHGGKGILHAESKTAPKLETAARPADHIPLQPQTNDEAQMYETGTIDMVCRCCNIIIEAIDYIGPDIKNADTVGLDMFGYQFDTTVSTVLEHNQKTHERKKLCTMATSFSADIYLTASSTDGYMTCNSLHSRCDTTIGSADTTFDVIEPETYPAFDQDKCLTINCTIGSQLSKKGPNTDPACPAITVGTQSRCATMIDPFLSCSATLQETAIDWIGGGTHTPANPDHSTDLRMHVTGILYHSRAASLAMLSSTGWCVSRTTTTTIALTTTTTSTNTALTTTTARRHQLLLADFMSGG